MQTFDAVAQMLENYIHERMWTATDKNFMKTTFAGLLVCFCCSASATSMLMQESSWHREDSTFEDSGGGSQIPSGTSTDDLYLITVGQVACGGFNSTVASFQPKSDRVVFVGFRTGVGSAHVYFVDDWWGEPDPGEANITQRSITLKWAMTRTPDRGYLDPQAVMHRGVPVPNSDTSFRAALRLGCAEIAHDLGQVNSKNADEALKSLNALLNIK